MRVILVADEAVIGLGHFFDFYLLIDDNFYLLVDITLKLFIFDVHYRILLRLHDGESKLFIKYLVKLFI